MLKLKRKLTRIKFIAPVIVFLIIIVVFSIIFSYRSHASQPVAQNVAVSVENPQIMAKGIVTSEDQAALHFLTSGKLVYLPFKEGDTVSTGQTIAQLDPYPLQEQLKSALNSYRSTRDTFDQTQDNTKNGILQGAQKFTLDTQNKSGIGGQGEIDIINDMAKRIVDQNQANLDNSVINVELANYAVILSRLTSPISGVIFHEDVTEPNLNVSPATTFIIANPDKPVLQAQVSDADIDFIQVGNNATIKLDSTKDNPIDGKVTKIYPEKISTPTGDSLYKVEVESDQLKNVTKLGATATVFIESKLDKPTILAPTWTILDNHYIWVLNGNSKEFRSIKTGDSHGSMTEILEGLSQNDRIITDPKSIITPLYKIL